MVTMLSNPSPLGTGRQAREIEIRTNSRAQSGQLNCANGARYQHWRRVHHWEHASAVARDGNAASKSGGIFLADEVGWRTRK